MDRPLVSIIIPCLNHWEHTVKCVKSLYEYTPLLPECEVIIVDDGSTDDTRKKITDLLDYNYSIIRHWPKNQGFAPTANDGIRASDGKYIAICNNDFLFGPEWLERLVEGLEKEQEETPIGRGGQYWMLTSWLVGSECCQAPGFIEFSNGHRDLQYKTPITWTKGGPWVFKRECFDEVGYFDEQFLYGQYEDTDFLMRMSQKQMLWGMLKSSICYHFGSVTQHGELRKRVGSDYIADNKNKFRAKWGSSHVTPAKLEILYVGGTLIPDGL